MSAFREVEGRLVLTADAERLQKDLQRGHGAVMRFKSQVEGGIGAVAGGIALFKGLKEALAFVSEEFEKGAEAAYKYSAAARAAKWAGDIAERKRDIALGNASAPAVVQDEKSRAAIAEYQAARARELADTTSTYAGLKSAGRMGKAWVEEMYAGLGKRGLVDGLSPQTQAETFESVHNAEMGGSRGMESYPGFWQTFVQIFKDQTHGIRHYWQGNEGGG